MTPEFAFAAEVADYTYYASKPRQDPHVINLLRCESLRRGVQSMEAACDQQNVALARESERRVMSE
eukprot:CAMPEP_0197609056 /NCGR_PEP_ID=MMETSP1326-20131121/50380_1 /TAXON_ID=1155430 /ORGANISM="Genus nov. species nov., Strain RCC2288" /LENGTH=65 /DNA_ID=CAMNT_0043177365 /DNA_START=6 /DNA_END=200 /DNA_ORIENTATION=+